MFPYSGGELPYPAGGELPYPGGDPYVGVSGVDVFRTEPPVLSVPPETAKISTCLCFLYFFIFIREKSFFSLLEQVEFTSLLDTDTLKYLRMQLQTKKRMNEHLCRLQNKNLL